MRVHVRFVALQNTSRQVFTVRLSGAQNLLPAAARVGIPVICFWDFGQRARAQRRSNRKIAQSVFMDTRSDEPLEIAGIMCPVLG